ncbi:ABC-2 type transport system permease protein [Planifilum fimeticola]|jgi:ABC-2 type transport system permease protein|uniref:ABC-2 type transport system permease protein n=1 Tax=Planifilum fimeticola TaxID=201975 RepID=A0A2T0LAZ2_9BACL|nr:ABC transporter permease [Planifilum fimeticola]PRX39023.1 ABC-2 type transport system permease protein [Planifilum fimeticola]
MAAQSNFWALVKHDFKRRKRRNMQIPKGWWLAYAGGALAVLLTLTTYAALHGHTYLGPVWFTTFGLPFLSFGMATSLTASEWKNGTAGWWLTLPFSRLRLVTSKFVAALLRSVLIFAVVYCILALFGLYTMALVGPFDPHSAASYLLTGLKWNALLFSVCPFVTAFGILFCVLGESRAKPAIPLMWILFSGLWWLLFAHGGVYLHVQTAGMPNLSVSPFLFIPIVVSWLLAYGLIRLAAYLLNRHLAM